MPPAGLVNLGNTCYLNSSLQALAACRAVQAAVETSANVGPVARDLLHLVAAVSSSSSLSQNPSALYLAVCTVAPHFAGYRQQDAHEFIFFLLDALKEEASGRAANAVDQSSPPPPLSSSSSPTTPILAGVPSSRFRWKEGGMDWTNKHADFWFKDGAAQVKFRVPPDEDDEPGALPASEVSSLASDDAFNRSDEDFENDSASVASSPPLQENNAIVKNSAKDESSSISGPRRDLVAELFELTVTSLVKCDDCRAETRTPEKLACLSLALTASSDSAASVPPALGDGGKKGGGGKKGKKRNDDVGATSAPTLSRSSDDKDDTLEACLARFCAPEHLSVKEGSGFRCNKCAKEANLPVNQAPVHDAVRSFDVVASEIAVFHFKRFSQVRGPNGKFRTVKNTRHVDVSNTLELGKSTYELRGIVEHLGASVDRGHYIAHVKYGSEWYRCSDTQVSSSSKFPGNSAEAYIAVYERSTMTKADQKRSVL